MRRIHRIFPLYFGWLALFALGRYLHLDDKLNESVFGSTLPFWMFALFLQNNASPGFNAEAWMAVTWSLAVEEQFYCVLPSLIRFLNKTAGQFVRGGYRAIARLPNGIRRVSSKVGRGMGIPDVGTPRWSCRGRRHCLVGAE